MSTASTHIYCPSCGGSLPHDAAYCRHCGDPVSSADQRRQPDLEVTTTSAPADRDSVSQRSQPPDAAAATDAHGGSDWTWIGAAAHQTHQTRQTRQTGQTRPKTMRTIEIVVEPLLLWVGRNDVFHLPNISRVSVQQQIRRAPIRMWLILGIIALSAIVSVGQDSGLDAPLVIIFLGTGGYLSYSVYGYTTTPPLNFLIIEAGTAYPILASRQAREVDQLKTGIVEALRNPPPHRQVLNYYGDFISGNTINQGGGGNIVSFGSSSGLS